MEKESQRLEKYIKSLEKVLKDIKYDSSVSEIVHLAKCYTEDSKYYYRLGDYFTALSCIAYAEGLLDAIRFLKKAEFTWPKEKPSKGNKVLVGGVFEILHPGHIFLLKNASKYGKVIVIVARDKTVLKFKKRKPVISENQRLEVVSNIKYVYKARLGEEEFNLRKILLEEKPDYVILGPDQEFLEDKLLEEIKRLNLNTKVIRIKDFYKKYSLCSTSKIIEKIKKEL